MTIRNLALLLIAAVALIGLGYAIGSLRSVRPAGTPTEVSPEAREAIERVPDWGDFPGAPGPIEVPEGGRAAITIGPHSTPQLEIERADGTPESEIHFGPDGRPVEARSYDEEGNLSLVVSSVRALPGPRNRGAAGAGGALQVRCSSAARRSSGWRIPSGAFDWKLRVASVPTSLRSQGTLAALRRAHATWNANRTHCPRLRDQSSVRFRYTGGTNRGVGRNSVNSVGFGDVAALGGVCAGSVACTLTWLNPQRRVVESDTRFNLRIRGGFSVRLRSGSFDLQSIMTHEAGHTLGFGHVTSNANVMYSYARRGNASARRLGKGDALINNTRY